MDCDAGMAPDVYLFGAYVALIVAASALVAVMVFFEMMGLHFVLGYARCVSSVLPYMGFLFLAVYIFLVHMYAHDP